MSKLRALTIELLEKDPTDKDFLDMGNKKSYFKDIQLCFVFIKN